MSALPAAPGPATTDQVAPTERSIRATTLPEAFTDWPTPKHVVAFAHDTPASAVFEIATVGSGPLAADHLEPFQCSRTTCDVAPVASAKQLVSVEHSTRWRVLNFGSSVEPATIDQLPPSQCSTTSPTAKQFASLEHDTLDK